MRDIKKKTPPNVLKKVESLFFYPSDSLVKWQAGPVDIKGIRTPGPQGKTGAVPSIPSRYFGRDRAIQLGAEANTIIVFPLHRLAERQKGPNEIAGKEVSGRRNKKVRFAADRALSDV